MTDLRADQVSWTQAWQLSLTEASRAGPEGYVHGWIYVGAPGLPKLEAEAKELGPGIGRAHIDTSDSHLADIVEEHGHANFLAGSPRIERVRAELKRRGITTKAEPATDSTGRRVHVYDVAQRRPAGGNQGDVLPGRARKVADRVMADMSQVHRLDDDDLRGAERELNDRLRAGTGDADVIRLRLKAIRARLRALRTAK